MNKPTKTQMLTSAVTNGILYNAVEVALIVAFGGVLLMGNEIWAPVLWAAFSAAALWTVLASTDDAQDEAHALVLQRDVFITDFMFGAFYLCVLGVMTVDYGLHFGAIFLLAAIQNLRYTALAYDWLLEEKNRDRSKRNNLP